MAGFVPRGRAESALRFLPQKISVFEPFHTANHMLLIREMVDHLERDDVLTHVVAALRRRMSVTGRSWAEETAKAGAPAPLPEDPVAALALRLDVLKQIKLEKIDLRFFSASFYPGEHLNERLMHWKRAIVHPLCEDLRRLAKVLLDRLPADERFDIEELTSDALDDFAAKAFGSRAWTDADDAVEDKKAKLEEAVSALARAVKGAEGLTADQKHDLELEAKIVASHVRRGRTEGLAAQLEKFGASPSLEGPVAALKKLL